MLSWDKDHVTLAKGSVVARLAHLTLYQAVWVQVLARVTVLSCWSRHFVLTALLSTREYNGYQQTVRAM